MASVNGGHSGESIFRKLGPIWFACFANDECLIKHPVGFYRLRELLLHPRIESLPLELTVTVRAPSVDLAVEQQQRVIRTVGRSDDLHSPRYVLDCLRLPRVGENLDKTTFNDRNQAISTSTKILRDEGQYWTIVYGGKCIRLPNRKGLKLIAILLANPGRELHVLSLVQLIEGLDPESIGKRPMGATDLGEMNLEGGLGPLIDDRARLEYGAEIKALEEQIEEAERFCEVAKASLLREHLQRLIDELAKTVGFRGKRRPICDAGERARTKIRKNFKSTLEAIRGVHESLGDYLEKHVKTGCFCSYNPVSHSDDKWTIE